MIPTIHPLKVTYRPALIGDADRVSDIFLLSRKKFLPYAPLAHSDQEVRDWIKNILIPTAGVSVALVGESIVGMMALSQADGCGWIDHLYFDPAHVGKGLGGTMMQQAKTQLGSPIQAYTFQENKDARNFYKRHGFQEILFSDGATNEEKVPDVLLRFSI